MLRNYLSEQGVRKQLVGLRNDDIFILNNADELPQREAILFLKLHSGYPEPIGLYFHKTVYGFFWSDSSKTLTHSATTIGFLKEILIYKAATLRQASYDVSLLNRTTVKNVLKSLGTDTVEFWPWYVGNDYRPAGWHCSWCCTPACIIMKLLSAPNSDQPRWGDFAEKLNLTYVKQLIGQGLWFDEDREFKPVNTSYAWFAPRRVLENAKKFQHLLTNPYS